MKPILLLIDDDLDFTADFRLLLEKDFTFLSAPNGREGLLSIEKNNPDIVLLDLMLKDGTNGIEILKQIKEIDDDLPVIMITDYASLDTAVEAMKLGAFDYISKTPNLHELKLLIERSLDQRLEKYRTESFEEEIGRNYTTIIGQSKATKDIRDRIRLYAQNDNTVLILGESGVGKELVARKIHELSARKSESFIAVNCAALPKDLIESELFGYERGAFTGANKRKPGKFELAQNGTIFLDEISELNPDAQVKLLRVLQEKEFERVGGVNTLKTNVRIIAATNRDLKELATAGLFREDLFYRLDVLPFNVPPLRDRKEDIPDLVDHFIKKSAVELKTPVKTIPQNLIDKFLLYNWPGNIRELNNYVTRIMILSNEEISKMDIFNPMKIIPDEITRGGKIPETWDEMDAMRKNAAEKASRNVEKAFLTNLLEKFNGNVTKAADHIGINRSNLHKMIKKCGL